MIFTAVLLTGCSEKEQPSAPLPKEAPYEPVAARSIVYSWQSAYEAKLREFAASADYVAPSVSGVDGSMFDLADITGDGSPELIISPSAEHSTSCTVYTCADGAIKELGTIGRDFGTFTYYQQIGTIGEEFYGDGFVTGSFSKWNGTEFEQQLTYMDNSVAAMEGVEISHKINGEEVNLPAYDEAMKPYTEAKSVSLGRKYTFGDASIDYAMHCGESWGALNVLSPEQKAQFQKKLASTVSYITAEDNYAFELCDIDGDDTPELILSYGSNPSSVCRIYKAGETDLIELEGGYGENGKLAVDITFHVFFPPIDASAAQSLDGSAASGYTRSDSIMCVGRKYILDELTLTSAFV